MNENLFYCKCPILDGGNFPCGNCDNERKECDKFCQYYVEIKYTCFNCTDKETCEYAFDDFCTDGDCLAIK